MVSFSSEDLAQHAGISTDVLQELAERLPTGVGQLFTAHSFRKRRGGLREIIKPKAALDYVTKNLHRSFSTVLEYSAPTHVHGFVQGRSTLTNASAHLNKKCVLRVDLEDFFPSISSLRLKTLLQQQGYDEKAAALAASVVTIAGKLPIGLSTSPFLSNLAFQDTDRILAEYADAEGLSFTRYVDDLTFSGDVHDRHLSDIERILDSSGWSVNAQKTAFMRRGGRQYVTGLYVGTADRPRIPRATKRRMRATFHIIKKLGYDTYMTEFGGERDDMLPHRLRGWACYIAAVEPDLGFAMLRAFNDLLPDHYVSISDYVSMVDWIEFDERSGM
ncbi:reverse transcriptase family protein [Catellatospora sp. NPDC049609]|uniref:reverse transcriptase family protein n=1 Tax=Catellatospora sp. NPDC049609 TaxID=3155505 RepID=UPI003424D16E